MKHTISFRRPELTYVLSKMSVPPTTDVAAQVRRLVDLGYKIIDVSPPLERYGPPQNPHPPTPALSMIEKATSWFHNDLQP